MKIIAILFFAATLSFSLYSCDSIENSLNEMQEICEDVEENYKEYTDKDLEKITLRFSEIEEKMEERELTKSEQKRLAKLKGKYYGIVTKNALNESQKKIKKISEELESLVEGFIEGLE